MAHRTKKETKLQPGTAGPGNMLGCCFVSFHFLWAILCPQAVQGARALSRRAKTEEGKKGGKGELGARARNEGKETKPDLPTSDIVTPVLVILSQNVI